MLKKLVMSVSERRGNKTLTRLVTGEGYSLMFEEGDSRWDVDRGAITVDQENGPRLVMWLNGWVERLNAEEIQPPLLGGDIFEIPPKAKSTQNGAPVVQKRMETLALRIDEDGLKMLVCSTAMGGIEWYITYKQIVALAEEVRQFFPIEEGEGSPA